MCSRLTDATDTDRTRIGGFMGAGSARFQSLVIAIGPSLMAAFVSAHVLLVAAPANADPPPATTTGVPAGHREPNTSPEPNISPATAAQTMVATATLPSEGESATPSGGPPPVAPSPARTASNSARTRLQVIADVPGLEPLSNGGYRYEGRGISATIAPDGQVKIHDKFFRVARTMTPLPRPNRDDIGIKYGAGNGSQWPVTSPWLSLQFNSDAQGWIEHKVGNDPNLP